jgi:hypothetical protein
LDSCSSGVFAAAMNLRAALGATVYFFALARLLHTSTLGSVLHVQQAGCVATQKVPQLSKKDRRAIIGWMPTCRSFDSLQFTIVLICSLRKAGLQFGEFVIEMLQQLALRMLLWVSCCCTCRLEGRLSCCISRHARIVALTAFVESPDVQPWLPCIWSECHPCSSLC